MELVAHERLQKLDGYQKSVIYELYREDDHTAELPIHDGAVHWLEQNIMILRTASQNAVSDLNYAVFPYVLQPWVIGELEKDKELLFDFHMAYDRYEIKYKNRYEEKKFYGPYYGYLF